jgi:hypothetical protein
MGESRAVQLVFANEVPGVRTDSEREELRGNVHFCHRSTTLFLNIRVPHARRTRARQVVQ